MAISTVNHLAKAFGPPVLFNDLNLLVNGRERVAIIGGNGTGKSTLLKIIMGFEKADSGNVGIQNGLTIGYLPQICDLPEGANLHQAVLGIRPGLTELAIELQDVEDRLGHATTAEAMELGALYADLSHQFEAIEGYSLKARAAQYLLAHDYDFVVQQSSEDDHTMWGHSEQPGPIVFPFLALAASGGIDIPSEGSSLAHLLDAMAGACSDSSPEPPLLPDTGDEPTELLLGRVLLDTLACYPVTPEDRVEYLDQAVMIAKLRAHAIVSNTLRGEYQDAARLVVTIGETMVLQGESSAGLAFTASIREAYPRHVAFHRELEQLIGQSPYHPPLLRRRK